MKKAIAVLENNLGFLQILLDNLQEHEMKDITLILVNETRVTDLSIKINSIVSNYNFNYIILTSDEINEKFKLDVIDNNFVNTYTMSMNILMLWYIHKYLDFDKVLFIDDDVVLLPNFSSLFDLNTHGFYYHRLCAGNTDFYTHPARVQDIFLEWFKIFDINFSEDFWKFYLTKYINTGQFLILKNDFNIKEYELKLKLFFNSEIIENDWNHGKVHTSGFLDEKFISLFFIKKDFIKINKYVKLYLGIKNISLPTTQSILHIAASSHKYEVYNYLINHNIISGSNFPDVECIKTKLGFTEIGKTKIKLW